MPMLGFGQSAGRSLPGPRRVRHLPHRQGQSGWGHGVHVCLGMHLARLEMRTAINLLLDRLPNLRLDPDGDDPHIRGQVFRSPTSLPVLFDPPERVMTQIDDDEPGARSSDRLRNSGLLHRRIPCSGSRIRTSTICARNARSPMPPRSRARGRHGLRRGAGRLQGPRVLVVCVGRGSVLRHAVRAGGATTSAHLIEEHRVGDPDGRARPSRGPARAHPRPGVC